MTTADPTSPVAPIVKIDPYFRVEVLEQTPNPQKLIYADMHQCYAEDFVFDEMDWGNRNDPGYTLPVS